MSKKLFIVSLMAFCLALPALADGDTAAANGAEPSGEPEATPEPSAVEEAAPAACESPAPTALDPFLAEPFQELQPAAGETCGGAVCGRFEYCCNPSCSRCVLIGMSCTQESCN